MIEMTERAAERFKAVIQSKSLPDDTMLRIDTEAEPDTDVTEPKLSLKLYLDSHEPGPEDAVEVSQGVRVAVDRSLAETLGDGELDYSEDEGGFVFARA